MNATGKYSQGLMGPAISEGSFKLEKIYIPSYSPGYGEFKICFIFVVSVSRAFVYNAIDVNKL